MKKPRSRSVVEVLRDDGDGITYQRELVRCGNARCKRCRRRPAHGPYWYSYRWSRAKKRLVSKYEGKELKSTSTGARERDR